MDFRVPFSLVFTIFLIDIWPSSGPPHPLGFDTKLAITSSTSRILPVPLRPHAVYKVQDYPLWWSRLGSSILHIGLASHRVYPDPIHKNTWQECTILALLCMWQTCWSCLCLRRFWQITSYLHRIGSWNSEPRLSMLTGFVYLSSHRAPVRRSVAENRNTCSTNLLSMVAYGNP
jgi:hypothetical protein